MYRKDEKLMEGCVMCIQGWRVGGGNMLLCNKFFAVNTSSKQVEKLVNRTENICKLSNC